MIAAAHDSLRELCVRQNPAYRLIRYFSTTYGQFWRNCAITVTRVFAPDKQRDSPRELKRLCAHSVALGAMTVWRTSEVDTLTPRSCAVGPLGCPGTRF